MYYQNQKHQNTSFAKYQKHTSILLPPSAIALQGMKISINDTERVLSN
jgi:hypothetical protein